MESLIMATMTWKLEGGAISISVKRLFLRVTVRLSRPGARAKMRDCN